MKPTECHGCKYNHLIRQDQFGKYLGCYKEPYKGKWVVEIDKCPNQLQNKKEKKNDNSIT